MVRVNAVFRAQVALDVWMPARRAGRVVDRYTRGVLQQLQIKRLYQLLALGGINPDAPDHCLEDRPEQPLLEGKPRSRSLGLHLLS